MDGSPGLIAAGAAMVGNITTAWINRGSAAGAKEAVEQAKAAMAKVDGFQARLVALEKLAGDVATLRTHINTQLAAAKRDWGQLRRATTSHPAIVIDEDTRANVEEALRIAKDAMRRIEAMESERREERAGEAAKQREMGRIIGLLEGVLNSKRSQG